MLRTRYVCVFASAAFISGACGLGEPDGEKAPGENHRTGAIVDDFSRRQQDGWGSAGDEPWEYTPTSGESFDLSVDGERGVAASEEGENKGNLLVGPVHAGTATARATFSIEEFGSSKTSNHVQLLVRASQGKTYYAFLFYPDRRGPARASIFSAKSDEYETLKEVRLDFAAKEEAAYVIQGRVADSGSKTQLFMRAWPSSESMPDEWTVTATDGSKPILQGRAGVRLSFYWGPARMTVDDFSLRLEPD